MKKTLLFATFFLTTLTMVGSAGLTWNCLEGQTGFQGNGNCAPGRVAFSGSGYPSSVHINVQNSAGMAIDDYDYNSSDGTIQFTETLVPSDTYAIVLTGANGLRVAQSVTTGGND